MGIAEDIKQSSFKNEYAKVVVNLLYTNSWLNQRQLALFKPHGLTIPQYNILRILRGQHPNACTVNMLIDRMLDKSSNASRIVDRLEEKGLVVRKQCQGDRRAVDVVISEFGLETLKRLDDELDAWEKDICRLSEDESKTLNLLLDKMRS